MFGVLEMMVLFAGLKKKSESFLLPLLTYIGDAIGVFDGKLKALVPCPNGVVVGVLVAEPKPRNFAM